MQFGRNYVTVITCTICIQLHSRLIYNSCIVGFKIYTTSVFKQQTNSGLDVNVFTTMSTSIATNLPLKMPAILMGETSGEEEEEDIDHGHATRKLHIIFRNISVTNL